MKKIITYICIFFLTCGMLEFPVAAKEEVVVWLDPGHGGYDGGASAEWFGDQVLEKDLNLTIAKYLKEELETYQGIEVKMTRTDDTYVSLEKRTKMAQGADALVSLHNNASGAISDYDNGCTVLTSRGTYKKELALEGKKLGSQILEELSLVGLENQGILQRTSETGAKYPNGELADYYHIVKKGMDAGYMAIIVEHAFVDHGVDYKQYLRTDGALERLAKADAMGIARYYGLHKKGQSKVLPRTNVKEKITLVGHADGQQSQITYETFYQTDTARTEEGSHPEKKGLFEKVKSLIERFFTP